ncbi:hypothetical protein QR680_014997 [Steinernema hermaphroditum]|uniref:Uncharacterized protein n=1 Tax=Steinernema hermaphroditum TaxID=289476 RepID=A0AA39IAR2_9BILA|nr:hypothetical protein QR680_014997 [Steinernema hermaphroditum]
MPPTILFLVICTLLIQSAARLQIRRLHWRYRSGVIVRRHERILWRVKTLIPITTATTISPPPTRRIFGTSASTKLTTTPMTTYSSLLMTTSTVKSGSIRPDAPQDLHLINATLTSMDITSTSALAPSSDATPSTSSSLWTGGFRRPSESSPRPASSTPDHASSSPFSTTTKSTSSHLSSFTLPSPTELTPNPGYSPSWSTDWLMKYCLYVLAIIIICICTFLFGRWYQKRRIRIGYDTLSERCSLIDVSSTDYTCRSMYRSFETVQRA